jgi:hypothetical protein
MAAMSADAAAFNPYELTALQIAAARAQDAFRSRHRRPARQRLATSDELIDWVERCRLQSLRLVPSALWQHAVFLTATVDPALRRRLGSDRRPDHVSEILFDCQARILDQIRCDRDRGRATVIPLFSPH